MNFIELHIGDWIKNTRKLALLERAIYMELVLAYYTEEAPFATREDAYATINPEGLTRAMREAVDKVLERKFSYVEGKGYTQERCDQEIHRYQQKRPAAEQKRKNDRERQDRARERRNDLFQQLRELGITAPWDATTGILEAALRTALASQARKDGELQFDGSTASVTGTVTPPVTRDNTATSPQSPVPSPHSLGGESFKPGAGSAASVTGAHAGLTEKAKEAADAMKQAGLAAVDAGDPMLLELLRQGCTVLELSSAAAAATRAKKGFAWALARAKGRRADAASEAGAGGSDAPTDWRESREGVEAMGVKVGIGKWAQIEAGTGRTEHWPAYKARVLRKAEEQGEAICTDT